MIKTGMLWLDDNSRHPFSAKVERAIAYYKEKYGRYPNVCYIHPSCMPKALSLERPIDIRTAKDVLPHHFLLGITHPT